VLASTTDFSSAYWSAKIARAAVPAAGSFPVLASLMLATSAAAARLSP
jgi:hypothetical protein